MSWNVKVTKSALKQLKKFPKKDANNLIKEIEYFEVNPYYGDIRKTKGKENIWRRRVGKYRVIYEIFTDENIVSVFNIEYKTTKTYKRL